MSFFSNGKNRYLYVYTSFTLLILAPLSSSGYVLTVDMPWGPIIPHIAAFNNTWSLNVLMHITASLWGNWITQKMILMIIFILASVGPHQLMKCVYKSERIPLTKARRCFYFAGFFYTFNPFIYSRFMQGQWLVLFGYALLPWAVSSFYTLMRKPCAKQAVKAIMWTTAVGLVSIHTVSIVLLAHAVVFIVISLQDRTVTALKQRLKYIALASLAWLLVNSFWVLPILTRHSRTSQAISTFHESQLHAFATVGTVGGSVPLSTLLLEGFWPDLQGRYVLPSSLGWWWYIVAAAILSLVAIGIYKIIKQRDQLGISLVILGVIGWWLAMGIGSSWSAGTTHFLINHVPFYRGYREPQKWLMLLALLYSYAGAIGLGAIADKVKNANNRQYVIGGGLLLPLLFCPVLLWGAGGQLRSAPYPKDYATVEARLNQDNSNYKVLVLPWHEYLPLSYAGRVVANPASHYFKQDMITGDNPELQGVPAENSSPLYRLINNQLLPNRYERTDMTSQLKPYNVRYVILLKEADWRDYGWLGQQIGLHKIQDGPTIRLYKLDSPQ